MLTEALLISFCGGAAGLLLAAWGTRALIFFVVEGSARTPFDPNPDLRVKAFTFCLAMLTGLLFGLAPAWQAASMNLAPGLRANSRNVAGGGSGTGRFGFSKVLVAAQVALSLVLLAGAGLLVRALRNLENESLGFNRFNLLEVDLDLGIAGYKPEQLNGLYERLLGNLSSLPGVRSASMSAVPPLSDGSWNLYIFRHGQKAPSANDLPSSMNSVTPEYFETSGTALVAGRAFRPNSDVPVRSARLLCAAPGSRKLGLIGGKPCERLSPTRSIAALSCGWRSWLRWISCLPRRLPVRTSLRAKLFWRPSRASGGKTLGAPQGLTTSRACAANCCPRLCSMRTA
jgi:hypothetical protein